MAAGRPPRRRPARVAALAATGALLLCGTSAHAAPGDPDPAFGSGGIAPATFGNTARATGVAQGADGRLAIAGDVAGNGALIARFTSVGVLDASFAGTGSRTDRFGDGGEPPQRATAVAVQADGKIVIAGVAGGAWMLARYLPDGTPDPFFGAGGVTLRIPSDAGLPEAVGPRAIAIAADGRIVVAGGTVVATDDGLLSAKVVVARYSDRGVPDPAFGSAGFAALQLGAGSAQRHGASIAAGLALLADGRIAIAGRASDSRGADRAFVARLQSNGQLDASFARGGRLIAQLGAASAVLRANSRLDALALRADGSLLAAGRATNVAGDDTVLLTRLTPAGALDQSFGRGGVLLTQLGGVSRKQRPRSFARALVAAPDGGHFLAGSATRGALVARLQPGSGRLSCGFGAGGSKLLPAAGFDADGIAVAAVAADGSLVVAGRRGSGGVLLARVLGGVLAPPPAGAVRLRSFTIKAAGAGRGYAYGYVDGACRATRVRFAVRLPTGRTVRTRTQVVRAGFGPQVVCARLRGVRSGRRYRIRMLATGSAGSASEARALRAVAHPASLPQDGCAG